MKKIRLAKVFATAFLLAGPSVSAAVPQRLFCQRTGYTEIGRDKITISGTVVFEKHFGPPTMAKILPMTKRSRTSY